MKTHGCFLFTIWIIISNSKGILTTNHSLICVCVIDLDVAFAMDHASFFRMLFPGMTIDVSEIKDPDLVAIWHALPLGGEGLKSVQISADQSS